MSKLILVAGKKKHFIRKLEGYKKLISRIEKEASLESTLRILKNQEKGNFLQKYYPLPASVSERLANTRPKKLKPKKILSVSGEVGKKPKKPKQIRKVDNFRQDLAERSKADLADSSKYSAKGLKQKRRNLQVNLNRLNAYE